MWNSMCTRLTTDVSNRRDKDVIGILEDIAEESLERTNFFHSGPEPTWYALHADQEWVVFCLFRAQEQTADRHPGARHIVQLRCCSLVSCVQTVLVSLSASSATYLR